MKSEKGSALLTVILIVFVTATIGSAISSFVMMNYKLRNLDNRISKAEYEAEKIIDSIYMLAQESVDDTIINSRNNAISEIGEYIQNELNSAEGQILSGNDNWDEGEYIYIQNGTIKSNEGIIALAEDELYKNYCKADIYNNVYSKLSSECDAELINYNNEFGKSGFEKEIKLKDKTDIETDVVTVGVELYYKIVSSPPIQFSVDLVVAIPTLQNARTGNYNLNELINMTNWEMQDWGYL